MTLVGQPFPGVASPRVFGPGCGEGFAIWDPDSSTWREAGLAAQDRERGAPEFCAGWSAYGMTRRAAAVSLAGSGHEPAARGPRSWPTPKVTTNRGSRRSITRDGHWSAPGLEQAAELSEGILPREVGSLAEIRSPAARSLWPEATLGRSWGTPRASSGMTSRLRDPANIRAAEGRLEDQVAVAEGRPGDWLNPEWVEWLMGFPRGWTCRSAAVPTPDDGAVGRAPREGVRVAAPEAARVAAPRAPAVAGFARHGGDRRGPEKPRSPGHPEVCS
jgi:hypothetical protein